MKVFYRKQVMHVSEIHKKYKRMAQKKDDRYQSSFIHDHS